VSGVSSLTKAIKCYPSSSPWPNFNTCQALWNQRQLSWQPQPGRVFLCLVCSFVLLFCTSFGSVASGLRRQTPLACDRDHAPNFRSEFCTDGEITSAPRVNGFFAPIHQHCARVWTSRKYRFSSLRCETLGIEVSLPCVVQHASTNSTTLPIGRVAISTSQIYKVRVYKKVTQQFCFVDSETIWNNKTLTPLNQDVSTTSDFVNNLQYHKSKIVTFNLYGIEIAILR